MFCQEHPDVTSGHHLYGFSLGWSKPVHGFLFGMNVCLGACTPKLGKRRRLGSSLLSLQTFTESSRVSQLLLCNKQPQKSSVVHNNKLLFHYTPSGLLGLVDLGRAQIGWSALSCRSAGHLDTPAPCFLYTLGNGSLPRISFISTREHGASTSSLSFWGIC